MNTTNNDACREALTTIIDVANVPAHKLDDAEFLRASLNLCSSYGKAALASVQQSQQLAQPAGNVEDETLCKCGMKNAEPHICAMHPEGNPVQQRLLSAPVVKAEVPDDHAIVPTVESDALWLLYDCARRFLRYNGIDKDRASAAVDEMDAACERLKPIAEGNFERASIQQAGVSVPDGWTFKRTSPYAVEVTGPQVGPCFGWTFQDNDSNAHSDRFIFNLLCDLAAAPQPTQAVPPGYKLIEDHWLSNIWYAAEMLSKSESVIDRNEGAALHKLYAELAASPQPLQQGQWLPIESCPDDIECCLVGSTWGVRLAFKHSKNWLGGRFQDALTKTDEGSKDWDGNLPGVFQVFGYMPLPPAPVVADEKGGTAPPQAAPEQEGKL